jgi:hypothetical protein
MKKALKIFDGFILGTQNHMISVDGKHQFVTGTQGKMFANLFRDRCLTLSGDF